MNDLKEKVLKANLALLQYNLVIFTWGNVSAINRKKALVVIKPSGLDYKDMTVDSLTVTDLNGNIVEGKHKPSSDTLTHLELYKAFPDIISVVHTHSCYATSFAQACKDIPVYGTTHADYFNGNIPCTRILTEAEVHGFYEYNTGKVIIETFKDKNPNTIPAVIVANHGPFTWGTSPENAVHNSVVLEEVAKIAFNTKIINPYIKEINKYICDKHYLRKHGKDAYYGQ